MYTEARRKLYEEYCIGRSCSDCKVSADNPDHTCGRGAQFRKKTNGKYQMKDDEIIRAHKSAFGIDLTAGTCRSEDTVSHPSHYNQGGIECLDAMMAAYGKEATATFCLTNAFKYLWRTEHKNGIQDIDKAIWYLNKYKELKSSE